MKKQNEPIAVEPGVPVEGGALFAALPLLARLEQAACSMEVATAMTIGLLGASKPEPVLVNYPEAAAMLSISVEALEQRVRRGQMPPGAVVVTGRRTQFKVEALRQMKPRTRRSK